ncbi:DUF4214 domain-containing protein [Pseudomonas sp. NPDC087358]|uniref:DUF4214 domain-containing protein n=1 Tax=Pseudomonas sp. NPDC087358 TaxID=3364439 RepID=UPI003850C9AC
MASVTYSQPASSFNLDDWTGQTRTALGATYLQGTADTYTQMSGNFTYAGNSITGGTVFSVFWIKGGTTVLTIDGLKLDAVAAANATPTQLEQLARQGNDTVYGSPWSDRFISSSGNDTYNADSSGSKGLDSIVYAGDKSSISVSSTANASGNLKLYTVSTAGKVDTLNGVERIEMGDGSLLALDVSAGENAGCAYRLYQAAFDRKADTAGLNYWTKELDAGKSLLQVANGFVDSGEFKTLNPASDQNSLINNFYLHVLHRDADAGGLQYWNAQMSAGMTASEVLVSFSESQENIGNVAAELNNGVWLV